MYKSINENNYKNHRRVKKGKLKKGRLILVIFIVIMSVFGVMTLISKEDKQTAENSSLKKYNRIEEKKLATNEEGKEEKKEVQEEVGKKDVKILGTNLEGKKYIYDAKKIEERLKNRNYSNNGEKMVFLTFDDGSSTTVTPKVLKVLEEENVKATFFLAGITIKNGGSRARKIVKQVFDAGHAIGNHSYSHKYSVLYPGRVLDLEAFKNDFEKMDNLLKDILGEDFSTRVIRCPGGYMSWKGMKPLDDYLDKNNKAYIDWNSLSEDAEGKKKNAQELVERAIKHSKGKDVVVILMHDTYGKEQTAKALPQIIRYFKNNGYKFKTLA